LSHSIYDKHIENICANLFPEWRLEFHHDQPEAKDAANNISTASNTVSDTTSSSGGGTAALVLDNFDNSPSWPGSNDLGKWAGANSFANNSGVIESGALKLQYSNNGWLGSSGTIWIDEIRFE
jgi:hypothetical protein